MSPGKDETCVYGYIYILYIYLFIHIYIYMYIYIPALTFLLKT